MTAKPIDIVKVLEEKDPDLMFSVLTICRGYAISGDILLLMDLLAPEGARTYTVTNLDGTTRTIRN